MNYAQRQWLNIAGHDLYCVKITTLGADTSAVTKWMTISEDQARRIMGIVDEDADV
jgi:hypothetical protein